MDKIFESLFPKLKPLFEEFLKKHHLNFFKDYIEVFYWIIIFIVVCAITWILKSLLELVKKYRVSKNSDELLNYFSKNEVRYATSNYLTTPGQSNDPSDLLELREALARPVNKKNLITFFKKEFSKKNYDRGFYLILGDSGIGKTTFLINLYLKFKLSFFPIEKRKIYFISLADNTYKETIENLKRTANNSILLLDAFDEDVTSWEHPEENLEQLLKEVSGFSTVVLSSRGHFFSSKIQELSRIDMFSKLVNKEQFILKKIYLSPINDYSIYLYLIRKYIFKAPFKIYKSFLIVKQCPNLMVRPMLLNNVDYLLKTKKKYAFTAEIYLKLILSWISREKQFVDESSIMSFSKDVAVHMYNERNHNKGLFIQEQQLELYLKFSHVSIDTVVMKTRSLLNRTFDKYKFSHKSIFEYFLALSKMDNIELEYLHNMKLNNPFSLEGLSDAERFFNELFILKVTIPYLEKFSSISIDSYTISKTKSLNLQGSKIVNVLFLKEMYWLESLNLNRTLVRDLKPLYSLKNLKKIELKGTFYDSAQSYPGNPRKEVEELQDALPDLRIIN